MRVVNIQSEHRRLHILIALHLCLISLPYLWVALVVPDGLIWGGLLFNPDDQNVHLAWAKQTANGHFFVRDLFTTENLQGNSSPLFFNLLTNVVGLLSKFTTLAPVTIYHVLRLIFATLCLKWLHDLTLQWTSDARIRLTTVALAAFAGGAGWLKDVLPQLLANRTFIDRPNEAFPMMPEAFGLASAFVFTLNIASMALLCLIYARLLRAHATANRRDLITAAIAAGLLANIHTYDALPMIAIIVLATWWQMRFSPSSASTWKANLWVIGAACLPIAYQIVVFSGSEEFRLKAQTPTPAPPIWDILFSYGLLGILAVFGAYKVRDNPNLRWPIVWVIVTFAIIYAPVSFARKMIEGVHLPLCFLAAIAIIALLDRLPKRSKYLQMTAWAGTIGVLSISSLQFVSWCIGENWRDNNISRGPLMPPLLLSIGDMGALNYLNALPGSRKYSQAVLCLPKLGNYVPQATGLNVYIGHWAETLKLQGSDGKLAQMVRFYDGSMNGEQSRQWLQENRIGWIIEGQYERATFGSSLPSARLGLNPIYNENGTAIYAVP